MPRVMFLTTGLDVGGAEAQVVLLARALKQRGWSVSVTSLLPPRAFTEQLEAEGIPLFNLEMRRGVPDPRGPLRLVSHLRAVRPHVLHCHMVHANLLGRCARTLHRVPVVISTAHSLQEGGRMRELAYKATDFLSDLTTHVSQRGLDRYLRLRLIQPGKGMWVPNGLDVDAYHPDPAIRSAVRRRLDWRDDFIWLAVGNLREPKDYPTMLRAFRGVVARSRAVRLVIAGSGPLEAELRKVQLQLGLAESVSFLGARKDVPELLQAADAFVMSSSWEGTPMALLEASAAGLPAAATDVGGIGEVIRHPETGFLAEPGNPDALAAAMLRICATDTEARLAMGRAARAHVRKNYGIEEIANRWERLYSELLALKAPDRAGPLHGLQRMLCRRWM